MFLTDTQVLSYVAAILKQPSANALLAKAAWWSSVVTVTHNRAYNAIVSRMAARGYLLSQITAWDSGPDYEYVLSAREALIDNAVLSEAGDKFIQLYERYNSALNSEIVTIAGAVVYPEGSSGQPSVGPMLGRLSFREFESSNSELEEADIMFNIDDFGGITGTF